MITSLAGNVVLILYCVAFGFVTIYCLAQGYLLWHYLKSRRRQSVLQHMPILPKVAIQLPLYNEKFVAARLIDAVCRIDYPRDLIEIQVLDDSTDETLAISQERTRYYQEQGFTITCLHRTERTGFKAGALAAGAALTDAEYVAIFDADFLPEPGFLRDTLPLFHDPNVGVVQTRWTHLNATSSLLTRIQAFHLNVHFTVEQAGRMAAGMPLQFNGTAGIWRVQAIRSSGGWHDDSLTEDLDLSYRAQLHGWKIVYAESVASPGELPVWMSAIKSQQFRWMKGGAQTAKKLLPLVWNSAMSFLQKLMATQHLASGMIFPAVLVLSLLSVPLLWIAPERGWDLGWLIAGIPGLILIFIMYIIGNVKAAKAMRTLSHTLQSVCYFPIFLSLSMALSLHNSVAVMHGFQGKPSAFVRTPKSGGEANAARVRDYLGQRFSPVWILEGMLAIYFLAGIIHAVQTGYFYFIAFHCALFCGYGTLCLYTLLQHRTN